MAKDEPFRPFLDNLKGYLYSDALSDATLRCAGKESKVHRIVLCSQSAFFRKAFGENWKEGIDKVIELHDDACLVHAMLSFLYGFDYDASGNDQTVFSPTVLNAKVYAIAEKYDIPGLKSQAKQKFEEAQNYWDLDDFPNAIAEVYNSTPFQDRGLRDTVVDMCCKKMDVLLGKQAFSDLLEGSPSFAADMTRNMWREMTTQRPRKYKCPNCGTFWEAVLPQPATCFCLRCGQKRSNWSVFVVPQ